MYRIRSRLRLIAIFIPLLCLSTTVFGQRGASVPWTTYEAENMTISGGTILGPSYAPNQVASESSGRECVQLNAQGQYLQFNAQAAANAMIVRYSVPDTATGGGTNYTLSLYINGSFIQELPLTSMYSWQYGTYPWTNKPSAGSPRNFYDEVRTIGLTINPGDTVQLMVGPNDTATNYDIDLVDLENVAAPLSQPANSLSIVAYGADNTGTNDSTTAFTNCVANAHSQGMSVWIPPGTYKISQNITVPSNLAIQGAGMWYSTLVGDPTLYNIHADVNRRVAVNGNGNNIQLSDFAIIGRLNYRADNEANDGIGGSYGTGSTIARLWIEHTKTGIWIENSSGLVIDSCRMRDTMADGCNINIGIRSTTVTNCATRNTGDDCFAMWPESSSGTYAPGLNLFTHDTAELPWLANGGALYGGTNNTIDQCLFQDLTYGSGILISSTFTVGKYDLTGITTAQNSDVIRCGGFDPNGNGWRGAVQLCVQLTNIWGVNLNNLNISNSASDGLDIVSPGNGRNFSLTNAIMSYVSIPNNGLGAGGRYALWAENSFGALNGSMTVSNCTFADYLDSSPTFTFIFVTNYPGPPAPNISQVTPNFDGSITIGYTTTPGFTYHIESTPTLEPASWTTANGSTTNATGSFVNFTDLTTLGTTQKFYRSVSP